MSCTESCRADAGARNPSTLSTWVALDGVGSAVGVVVVSAAERFLSTGTQAAPPRATATSHAPSLMDPPRPPTSTRPDAGGSLVRLRLGQLLLAPLHHLLGHVGRHLLVGVEFLPVRAAPVRQRVQRRRVAVELRLRDERLHVGQAPLLLGAEDVTAPRRQIAHYRALVIVRRQHLHLENRLEQRRLAVGTHAPQGADARPLLAHL